MRISRKRPMLRGWEICCERRFGPENRALALRELTTFFQDCDAGDRLVLTSNIMLFGDTFAHDRFGDHSLVITNYIESLECKGTIPPDSDDLRQALWAPMLYCALTATGNKYYFYRDDVGFYTGQLLYEYAVAGEVNIEVANQLGEELMENEHVQCFYEFI